MKQKLKELYGKVIGFPKKAFEYLKSKCPQKKAA